MIEEIVSHAAVGDFFSSVSCISWVMRHRTYETPQVSARSKGPGVELLSLALVAGTQVLDCVANFVLVESLSLHVQPNAVFNV